MAHQDPNRITKDQLQLDGLAPRLFKVAGIVGLAGLAISVLFALILENGIERLCSTYLVSYCYYLSLSLGALIFVLLQHKTHAGWSVLVRRLGEIVAGNFVLLAILFIPILLGAKVLYHWTDAEAVAADPLLLHKQPYLNLPFFLVRCVVYFGIWAWLSRFFLSTSTQQDESGDPELTLRMERLSAPGILLFALTITFFAFDVLMSLDAHWFSTIYGVYFFSGSILGFLAFLIVVCMGLQSTGRLAHCITREHYHDLGKLLFAFVFFWGYIAFSQYMLIWYGNIPEETGWYFRRQEGPWAWMAVALVFGHFLIPFVGLLSRRVKRRKRLLIVWAVWMLVMHWFDLYWLIVPEMSPGTIPLGLLDITCFVGLGGLYLAGIAHVARPLALIPKRDPRLMESLTFENA